MLPLSRDVLACAPRPDPAEPRLRCRRFLKSFAHDRRRFADMRLGSCCRPEISQHHVSHDELAQGWLARARWDSNSFASGVHAPQRLVIAAGSIRCQPTSLNKLAKGSLSND